MLLQSYFISVRTNSRAAGAAAGGACAPAARCEAQEPCPELIWQRHQWFCQPTPARSCLSHCAQARSGRLFRQKPTNRPVLPDALVSSYGELEPLAAGASFGAGQSLKRASAVARLKTLLDPQIVTGLFKSVLAGCVNIGCNQIPVRTAGSSSCRPSSQALDKEIASLALPVKDLCQITSRNFDDCSLNPAF